MWPSWTTNPLLSPSPGRGPEAQPLAKDVQDTRPGYSGEHVSGALEGQAAVLGVKLGAQRKGLHILVQVLHIRSTYIRSFTVMLVCTRGRFMSAV